MKCLHNGPTDFRWDDGLYTTASGNKSIKKYNGNNKKKKKKAHVVDRSGTRFLAELGSAVLVCVCICVCASGRSYTGRPETMSTIDDDGDRDCSAATVCTTCCDRSCVGQTVTSPSGPSRGLDPERWTHTHTHTRTHNLDPTTDPTIHPVEYILCFIYRPDGAAPQTRHTQRPRLLTGRTVHKAI